MFDDKLLVEMYVRWNVPCDRLVSDPAKLRGFADEYVAARGQPVQLSELSHHLLNLRRLGQAKGGLPRLRRRYNGRNDMN